MTSHGAAGFSGAPGGKWLLPLNLAFDPHHHPPSPPHDFPHPPDFIYLEDKAEVSEFRLPGHSPEPFYFAVKVVPLWKDPHNTKSSQKVHNNTSQGCWSQRKKPGEDAVPRYIEFVPLLLLIKTHFFVVC